MTPEIITLVVVAIVSTSFGSLFAYFVTSISRKTGLATQIREEIKFEVEDTHKVYEERFNSGNARFEKQDVALDSIQKQLNKQGKWIAWIVGKLKGNPDDII